MSEFEQIMRGTKPMVAYYRAEGEPYYYADRRSFLKEVKSGKLLTKQFIIKNARQDFKVEYEIFAPRSEAWRLDIYHSLKTASVETWNKDMELIESTLLGYY